MIKERDTEIAKLRTICQHQKDTVENVRSDLKQMKEIICQQSSYTASLGFTLSGLLWKASKDPYTVQNIITGVSTHSANVLSMHYLLQNWAVMYT